MTTAQHAIRTDLDTVERRLGNSLAETIAAWGVGRLLDELESEIPDVRQVMLAALKNVRATHLLDPEVAEAWERAAGDYEPRR